MEHLPRRTRLLGLWLRRPAVRRPLNRAVGFHHDLGRRPGDVGVSVRDAQAVVGVYARRVDEVAHGWTVGACAQKDRRADGGFTERGAKRAGQVGRGRFDSVALLMLGFRLGRF